MSQTHKYPLFSKQSASPYRVCLLSVYLIIFQLTVLFFTSSAQNFSIVPTCDTYKNLKALKHKVKGIEVYNKSRNQKIATYEYDRFGYLVRFDTLVYSSDTFLSQRKYVFYSNSRNRIVDSTVNLSKNGWLTVPPKSVRVMTLQCNSDDKKIFQVDYELTGGYRNMQFFHFNYLGLCDTIYRHNSGKYEVDSYFNYTLRSEDIIAVNKINKNNSKIENYLFDKSNKLLFYSDKAIPHFRYSGTTQNCYLPQETGLLQQSLIYNSEGLLVKNATYYFPVYSSNMYCNGINYDTKKTVYSYEKYKLNGSVTHAYDSNNDKVVGKLEEIIYDYSETGLLKEVIVKGVFAKSDNSSVDEIPHLKEIFTYKYKFY